MIPYGRQSINDSDVRAVGDVLRDDFLTTGPRIAEFEQAVCKRVGAGYGVAMSSGTAALHAAMYALKIRAGDEVIVPAITFAASANCILYQGGTPVFCDVDPKTLLIDVKKAEKLINIRTRAIVAVDYAGQPCDYNALLRLAERHGLYIVSDACHSLGAQRPTADIAVYSFHPVKHITTGEGGMAVTNDKELADRMSMFRTHGIFDGKMYDLGYNYRITDIQCALGISQLRRLDYWIEVRREQARYYDVALADVRKVENCRGERDDHVYHLYVIRVPNREAVLQAMRERGIRATVHYMPVYKHPYYQTHGYKETVCPVAEAAAAEVLSIPLYPGLKREEQDYVIKTLKEVLCQK